jgi:hypothetical protein
MYSCQVALPAGVNFEVPRDYAAFCRGSPVRLTTAVSAKAGLVVSWDATKLSMASGVAVVEYELPAIKGLLVNETEVIFGKVAAILRIVFAGTDGHLLTLPVLSANPRSIVGFREVILALSACKLPFRIASSVKDLVPEGIP